MGITSRRSSHRRTREHRAWANAKYRCRTPTAPAWERYGGRGIAFSPAWDRFEDFLRDMGPCPPGRTLERLDNDRGYEPGNCAWVSGRRNSQNRSTCVRWTFRGETLPVGTWADRLGCSRRTLRRRVEELGWSIERALTAPIRPKSDSRWPRG